MRPDRLNPLFAAADSLKGVGAGLARPLEKLGLTRIKDFAYHLPDRFVQRRAVENLDEASVGENVVVALTPVEHRASSGRGPFRVVATDSAGNVCTLTYFGRASYTARKQLPLGEPRWRHRPAPAQRPCWPASAPLSGTTWRLPAPWC